MSKLSSKYWKNSLATLAVATVSLQPHLLIGAEPAVQPAQQRAIQVAHDIMLTEGGVLTGRLVNEQGNAMAMQAVSLQTAGKEVARITTDKEGNFQAANLKGGVYQVASTGHQGVYRLWTAKTAPPAAQKGLTLVSHKDVVRGQFAPAPSNPLARMGQFIAEHPILTAGTIGAAIAIPIALDDDDPPGSP